MSDRTTQIDYLGLVDSNGDPISATNPFPVILKDELGNSIEVATETTLQDIKDALGSTVESTNMGLTVNGNLDIIAYNIDTYLNTLGEVSATPTTNSIADRLKTIASNQLPNGHNVIQTNVLVPDNFDYIALTYVAAGNGAGEVETATYKTGGALGTTVATLTIAYDANNEISSITKT